MPACAPGLRWFRFPPGARHLRSSVCWPTAARASSCATASSRPSPRTGPVRTSALGCQQMLRSTETDRWLLVLSPHHVAGLAAFLRAAVCNQPLITLGQFDEHAVLEALDADRPTLMSLVPTMLARLLDAGGLEPLRRLRAILVGGAP